MSSLNTYGKLNEADQARLEPRRQTRKKITIIGLSAIILVGVIVGAAVGTSSSSKQKSRSDPEAPQLLSSIKAVCDVTQYPDSCYHSLAPIANASKTNPEYLFQLSMEVAMSAISQTSVHITKLKQDGTFDNMTMTALSDCQELMSLAVDHLNESMSSALTSTEVIDDLKTWLSASGTYIQTCIDGFDEKNEEMKIKLRESMKNSTEFTSNSLAILTGIFNIIDSFNLRRLMSYSSNDMPSWASPKDRKLLQSTDPTKNADIVVAKDGSSKYKTIHEALKAVPEKSKKRFVIYVKKGVYKEHVRVEKAMWNVMMVGDGKDATIVTGSKNFVDGTPTFSTATFAAFGKGFIARDMGFYNTAGAAKHQAVALMSSSDESIFYRCRIDAFQDSLYAQANRQFYRECDIYGTVDFIFGNSAVVLQNCNIRPRVPMRGQQITITAQGKVDRNQNTGITIQNCTITPFGNLTQVRTYLGRPWKPYSTTVVMQSMIGSLLQPAGWLPWNGTTAPDTIFYSEFRNYGPGSSTKNRVKWQGLKTIDSKLASKFAVKSFLGGDKWIPKAGISYKPGV